MTRILGIGGSLRRDSLNRKLLDRAARLVPEAADFDPYDGIGELPFMNQDIEGERTPEAVLAMRRRIGAADALLLVTPEFNASMPGFIKNAIDWASRPPGESVLEDKPAAVIGASPGKRGAVRAQADARKVLTSAGANVLDAELPVPRAHEALAPGADTAELDRALAAHLAALVELAGGPPAPRDETAEYSKACQRLAAAG